MAGAAFAVTGGLRGLAAGREGLYEEVQREINAVHAADYRAYLRKGDPGQIARFAAFGRLEGAFERVCREVRETRVTDRPAIWFLYNMGLVIKTPKTCFSIDLNHRRAAELAPLLDFALVTHNHDDHYTTAFYEAMDGAGKTVISNFLDNYGVPKRHLGGYTRAVKTFRLGDVAITTGLTDHNDYLIDFTSTFEVKIGDFMLYHTGDCCNLAKLNPSVAPDLWCVHPRCGLDPVAAAKKLRPKRTAVLHLNEMGHEIDRWRWTWAEGLSVKASLEQAGFAAEVPLWGERL